jgi:hypothetical protein
MTDPDEISCTTCGTRLYDEHEITCARENAAYDDELVCDVCACERDHFLCCRCQECGEQADQHTYVVVVDPEAAGVALPGLYRVEHLPYYWGGWIGGGALWPQAMTWLGLLEGMETEGYPCGHLCADCQCIVLAELETHTVQMVWEAGRR